MSLNNSVQNDEHHTGLLSFDSIDSNKINRPSIERHRSLDDMTTVSEAKVLVIYTGGTIGMTRNSNNGMCYIYL